MPKLADFARRRSTVAARIVASLGSACAPKLGKTPRTYNTKVNTMNATKLAIKTDAAIPLIAALPFALASSGAEMGASFNYNPATQTATFQNGKGFSTCREDESVSPIWNSRSDTKKDD